MIEPIRVGVIKTRALSVLLGLVPFLAAAQPAEVTLPEIHVTGLSKPIGFSVATPELSADSHLQEIADRLAYVVGELSNNQSGLGTRQPTIRSSAVGKPAGASATSNFSSRKLTRLVGSGPGQPIAALKAPEFNTRLSKAGTIRSLSAPVGRVLRKRVASPGTQATNTTVMAFLKAHQPLVGLVDPAKELRFYARQTDGIGHSHLRYQQYYKDIPVWGAELIAQFDNQGNLITISGAYSPTPSKLVMQPTFSKQQALFLVKSKYPSHITVDEPELIIFSEDSRRPSLAWDFSVEVSALESRSIILNAHDGTELLSFNNVKTGQASGQGVDLFGQTQVFNSSLWESFGVYYLADTTKAMFNPASIPPDPSTSNGIIVIGDAMNSADPNPNIFFSASNTGPTGPWLPDGISAAVNMSATYDYFLQRLGRNSLDGNGGNMIGVVRVGQSFPNAYYNGSTQTMYFGDAEPFAGALDVVAHEISHGIIDTSARLLYFGQSGALNESFADIFGEMTEAHFNQANPDWLVGTWLSSPLRNMMNPGSLEFAPGRPYPSKMSEFVWPDDPVLNLFADRDNDGVHINSSIINYAYYLLTNAIPSQDADRIFYRALTTKLSALSEFADMRFAAVKSAEELFGVSSFQVQQTTAAFDSVEIFDTPTNPLPAPFPGNAGPDGTLFVYWDSFVGAYFLGRLDPSLGDTAPGIQLSSNPINGSPSVSGDGSFAVFVDARQDVCVIATDGLSVESCLGFPGEIASVAMAPDGETFGVVFLDTQGNPSNLIAVIDVATNQTQSFSLIAPNVDGASSIDVIQADTMDFTSDNRFLIYDAFNAINFNTGSSVGLWSIYAIDRLTNTTFALTTPTPGLNTANPSIAQTSDAHMTFDAFDLAANENFVLAANTYTGDVAVVTSTGAFLSFPAYTGDDSGIVFSFVDITISTGFNLWRAALSPDRISPTGTFDPWLTNAVAGSIYRHGAFAPAPHVDIGLTYSGSASNTKHVAEFNLEVANNGQNLATNVAWAVSLPPNIDAVVSDDGGLPNCSVLADKIECLTTEISAGSSVMQVFNFTLTSSSSSAQMFSSATAFAEQPDANTQDNTAIAIVSENDLNLAPVLVSDLPDKNLTEGVFVNFSVSGNFSDGDGDPLTFSISGQPSSLTIDTIAGTITGTPTSSDVGNSFTVTATASDMLGAMVSDSFTITIVQATPLDSDGDGMPDNYELANGFDPFDATDADEDADGDGFTNLEEFQAGTDPKNTADFPLEKKVPVAIFILLGEEG